MGHKLSVVIPIYNEINTLEEILNQVKAVDIGIEKEILLIDDCSTDGTHDLLRKIEEAGDPTVRVFYQEVNRGKGAALRRGFQEVTGDLVIVQDADLEYDPQDYPKLIRPVLEDEADVVYGSRFAKGRPQSLFLSYAANRFLTILSNLLNGLRLTDMETCYKVIKTSILRDLSLHSDRFGIEPEITAKLAKRKCRIVEVPVTYRGRNYEEGKNINWKDGFAAIGHIIRFRFFD